MAVASLQQASTAARRNENIISRVQQTMIEIFNEGLLSVEGYRKPYLRIELYVGEEEEQPTSSGEKVLVVSQRPFLLFENQILSQLFSRLMSI